MGYAVLRGEADDLEMLDRGVMETPREGTKAERLLALAEGLDRLIADRRPGAVAVERLFFNRNVRTAMAVSEARGVALLSAARAGLPVYEYTPHEVKLAVTGYGVADKRQVQEMLRVILGWDGALRQDDAADAVAIAVCHAQRARLDRRIAQISTSDAPARERDVG
jgi:crossover junction endodeoxyribonuclease RuvC